MVKPFNDMDKFTKKWVQKGGLESPSPDFSKNVMKAISGAKESVVVYQPLISRKGWFLTAIILISVAAFLYINPLNTTSVFDSFKLNRDFQIANPFEGLEFSRTMIYGIGFLALFFLQIPLIKKFTDRRFQ